MNDKALTEMRDKAKWARDYGDRQEAADAIERLALIDALEEARAALRLLVDDVADYEAWQRPCRALDIARSVLDGKQYEQGEGLPQ